VTLPGFWLVAEVDTSIVSVREAASPARTDAKQSYARR